jgi:hypothetical protein
MAHQPFCRRICAPCFWAEKHGIPRRASTPAQDCQESNVVPQDNVKLHKPQSGGSE